MRDYVGLDASRQPRGLVKPVHCGRALSPLGRGQGKDDGAGSLDPSALAARGVSGGQQDITLATGQPRLVQPSQPNEMLAGASVEEQPIQHAGAPDGLAARGLHLRMLDQALADLDDSMFSDPLHG